MEQIELYPDFINSAQGVILTLEGRYMPIHHHSMMLKEFPRSVAISFIEDCLEKLRKACG